MSSPATGKKGDDGDAEDKVTLAKLISEAGKVKSFLHNTTSAADSLLATIEADATWGWANTPHTHGKLAARNDAVDNSVSDFGKSILITDIAHLGKTHGSAFLEVELKKFNCVKATVTDLANYHGALVKMHGDFTSSAKRNT